MTERLPTADRLAALAAREAPAPLEDEMARALIEAALDGALDAAFDGALEDHSDHPAEDVEGEGWEQAEVGGDPSAGESSGSVRGELGAARAAGSGDSLGSGDVVGSVGAGRFTGAVRWLGVAAAAIGLFFLGRSLGPDATPAPDAEATRVVLPSGDALAVAPGARFAIERLDARRQVRLRRGAMSFDVAPLAAGESFEVRTPHLVARVVGTVFTVEVDDARSVVRVYEGTVVVAHDGIEGAVRAGERLAVGATDAPPDDPLGEIASAAARAREVRRSSALEPAPRRAGSVRDVETGPAEIDHAATAHAATDHAATDHVERGHVERDAEGVEDAPPVAPNAEAQVAPRRDAREPAARRGPEADGAPTQAISLAEARGWIAGGEPARALAHAQTQLGPDWRLVEGDALRVLGRYALSVEAYARAAAAPSHRVRAGFLVATTRAERLDDRAGALTALSTYGCAEEGSPLAERSLALSVRLLRAEGRLADARAAAAEYLARFPDGPRRAAMTF